MTDVELEALSVIAALPRPFSSRKTINCLEHDNVNSRVFWYVLLLIVLTFTLSPLTFVFVHVLQKSWGRSQYATSSTSLMLRKIKGVPRAELRSPSRQLSGFPFMLTTSSHLLPSSLSQEKERSPSLWGTRRFLRRGRALRS